MQDHIPKYPDRFLFWMYLIFFTSIIFSFRAASSISIGFILLLGLLRYKKESGVLFTNKALSFFCIGCSLLFFIQCLSLIYTNSIHEGINLLQRRSALVLIPLASLFGNKFLTSGKKEKLLWYFSVLLCLAAFFCLAIAFVKYEGGAPGSIFFYHDLVKPLSQHAIQFSFLVLVALLFLINSPKEKKRSAARKLVIGFLSLFLLLLSSKLIICFYVFYLLYFSLFKKLRRTEVAILAVAFISVVITALTFPSPVRSRFEELFSGNGTLFRQEKFDPGIYFNGAQFRLLQWRFTYEILHERHAWLLGVSPGDAQAALNQKYVTTRMYTGEAGRNDHGFIGYHTHNQFLQILLENGIVGLLIFLFIAWSLIQMARKDKNEMLRLLVLLILLYCFVDAPFETQYGLVLFIFFPLFLQSIHGTFLKSQSEIEPYPLPVAIP